MITPHRSALVHALRATTTTPLPTPPPQGGREQTECAARADSTSPQYALDRGDERVTRAHRSEDATLHLDHLQGSKMIAVVGRAAAILQQHAFESAVVRLAHGGVDADIRGDAGEHEVANAARAQDQLEIGGTEAALPGLVDDRFAIERGELGNDLPARLAAHEDAAARSGIADAGANLLRTPALVRGQIGQIRPVSLARMDDVTMLRPHRGEHAADRLDGRARQRKIVSHAVDVPAR